MDKALEKLLKKSDNIAHEKALPQASGIMDELHKRKNCLITMNDGAYKMGLLTNILDRYIKEERTIWLAFSPLTFSQFRIHGIMAGLRSGSMSVRTGFTDIDGNSPATLWSMDILRNSIHDVCSKKMERIHPIGETETPSPDREEMPGSYSIEINKLPDLLVIDNLDMLDEQSMGTCLEQILIGLPSEIPIVAFISPLPNYGEILDWLKTVREGTWGELVSDADSNTVMAYLTPEYDLVPLLQKKKIASRVKRTLKENRPIKYPASKAFIKPLMETLKQDNLTPAIIIMPSAELCDQAVQSCPKTRDNVNQMLSNPQITAMFDRYPELKDRSKVVSALYRQVGAFHWGNHPAWSEMVEMLLSLNLIDAVFSTMYDARAMGTRVKSVIFTTSLMMAPGETQGEQVSGIDFKKICQLADSMNKEDDQGCIILANGKDMDLLHLKDIHLLPSLGAIKSSFKCNTQSILGLAGITARGIKESLMMSLWVKQNPFKDVAPLIEKHAELAELVPQAMCGGPRNALKFIQRTEQLKFELDQCDLKIESVKKSSELHAAKKQHSNIRLALESFPCNGCAHKGDCQEQRYKKIREILNQYNDTLHQMKGSSSILEFHMTDNIQFLQDIEFLDYNLELTQKGKIALQTGCSNPFYITELILRQENFPWPSEFTIPVMAGFIELTKGEVPILVDEFADEELHKAYQWMDSCMEPVKKSLFSHGVIPSEPSFAQSAVVRALENGIRVEAAAESAKISVGTIIRLTEKTRTMVSRFFAGKK
ncbi:hypothetical protein MTBBW1_850041 [Desulfamplus magnetovallimortis]|uniref:Uncharacterized protein n=1 Tax=Desulfamplus magnetovallimortis TaxID=1246637 RepID=A0A1W1HKS0_9BACT|nr:hypothetical protein [Desulfamplus magnetovallimortis]SLM33053.1 hypothetical protein MTBBW1_850041 [Desulfamplus magnetovallimortis]